MGDDDVGNSHFVCSVKCVFWSRGAARFETRFQNACRARRVHQVRVISST
ncbi:hypothetical protein HMPREF0004_2099 [Achromobacter piechaudii ATCC 43553]|uniref:Uncharacterized protein n=1 Tax=Achromobacter piechaudii ATCC 43553 TaxID=742159 RepID=D4X9F2_9BURK|nr:hypothetical protein HMPREF0004_2099 [Achromobacter piechaudii ATCC 43553]